jgi:protoporphyrinogen/coproporphyrinogen III oxidase
MRAVVVSGGIAGLAAARRLEALLPDASVVLVEKDGRLGGKIVTERTEGFVIEGAPDSFLSRKERGVGLCEELGLGDELVGRRPENARSFVRRGAELLALPEGLTGMIPTDLRALEASELLSVEGRARLAAEPEIPPEQGGEDESVASFVSRRLGREAYEAFVEPLMTGIYGGDGEQLSLAATFPNLRAFELEHGSLLRGLSAQPASESRLPPFVTLAAGMDRLVTALVGSLERTELVVGSAASGVSRGSGGYVVELHDGTTIEADGVVIATPAFATADLLTALDADLAALHAEIPYASSAIVTMAYPLDEVSSPLDGYGYVVPSAEGSDVLACTWTSSKWAGRAPEGVALLRVYAGRFGGRDVTADSDDELVALARAEVRPLGIAGEPMLARVQRWPRGMPQYVLGHPGRLEKIDAALEGHPGLALAGAAYQGVGIPDCIRSGERAAQSVAQALVSVPG